MLLAVFLLAILATKTCAARDQEIDQDVQIRFVQRGLDARPYWAVSLSTVDESGIRVDCATVLIDWETGDTQTEAC
jgi:hypothetical protein